MTERKMASIQEIVEIKPIEGADKICAYKINGWWVVDLVGNYVVGDLVVYVEIDSWVPTELAPFLSKGKEAREFDGIKGEKLRTIRLKGQYSQGLLLPVSKLPQTFDGLRVGEDVSDILGIVKYEAPINAQLAGLIRGNFPSFVRKTDQERIQNLSRSEFEDLQKLKFEVTEKCEGSSCTAYMNNGEFGVCSRNLDLKHSDENTFWVTAAAYDLESKLTTLGRNIAIQAELIGPGIQDNIYKLSKHELRVFDMFNIDTQEYLSSDERLSLIVSLGLVHSPIIAVDFDISKSTVDSLIAVADGLSEIGWTPKREGLVFKSMDGKHSFKCISNAYLIKQSN
jgi:RNA ligase (TIGR02306 family)